jgi:hypothetical protein
MKQISVWHFSTLAALFCALIAGGCGSSGPELGHVSGKVTLNGQPLAEATVEFIPQSGRPSVGTTDADGQYVLRYTGDQPGALFGTHTVRITTQVTGFKSEGGEEGRDARKELVPPQYNIESELKREVKPGDNTFDFALESDGRTYPGIEGEGQPARQQV